MKKFFSKLKNKITKRNVLIFANVIFFVCVLIFCCLDIFGVLGKLSDFTLAYISQTVYRYLCLQCLFTFLSLIVYFLALMADALNKKYKEEVKDREDKIK